MQSFYAAPGPFFSMRRAANLYPRVHANQVGARKVGGRARSPGWCRKNTGVVVEKAKFGEDEFTSIRLHGCVTGWWVHAIQVGACSPRGKARTGEQLFEHSFCWLQALNCGARKPGGCMQSTVVVGVEPEFREEVRKHRVGRLRALSCGVCKPGGCIIKDFVGEKAEIRAEKF